jgi:D-glycerate 3-kinase
MPDAELMKLLLRQIRAALPARSRLLVIGICGAQGSGKTTIVSELAAALGAEDIRAATLSLDDLYLTQAQRQELARDVHPLLVTRGVPGTHDVALGLETIAALERGEAERLPRFDKGSDDRAPVAEWPLAQAGTQVLLLEGWCLGARPQEPEALIDPANALEAAEDSDGMWRAYANDTLAGPYRALFDRIDQLILLAAPDWSVVATWREQQEAGLRAVAPGAMTPGQVERFIQHYERLTRWILEEMPARADLVVRLGSDRQLVDPC